MDLNRSSSPVVNNIVYTGELKAAGDVNVLSGGSGLENPAYEPEQSPEVIFGTSGAEAVQMIFSSEKVGIIAVTSEQSTADAFDRPRSKIEGVFG